MTHDIAVKFLGSTEVEQPKGTEVVRDAVRKLKFARHIKKSEGQKIPKVELQISIYGVKILEPKTKEVQHNCQLHRISFCADDKTDKRIFTFICKDSESNKHLCYVFDSEKCAEEITLTIGQAFDLAYRKFLESGGKDVETRKQIAGLQKRIQDLETENMELKNKVQDLENQLRITQVSTPPAGSVTPKSPSTDIFDMIPFSPVSHQSSIPTHNGMQPPPVPSRSNEIKRDLFGAEPFDPFNCGAGDFPPDIQSKLDEMQGLGKGNSRLVPTPVLVRCVTLMSNIWKLKLFNLLSLPLKRVEILKFLLDLKTLEEEAVFRKEQCSFDYKYKG
ncbi:hypothetical protein E5288_WYG006291 [Bos mutus]|uniref:PTB domain-containing engulfment adapter protein 1 n=1 Tax=Bos mutus TaxID=72004 RepID=A0A6B0QY46_9CETA|nr:hypothetical protein [Bos mutus]